ncbi:MAG: VCBS repeat-containing protein, partial [Polyangiaceae bacterium]|nr:VCBS repeat-containing protein [Polyangiaceae bacterium]
THTSASDALKALSFAYPSGIYGSNLMSYDNIYQSNPLNYPRSLSISQIQLLQKYMLWGVTIVDANMKPGQTEFSANLPLLGEGNIRQVAVNMDFDCDGLRDIGVWVPPKFTGQNGTFKVWLSSKGYSNTAGQYMSVSFGQLGDIPVVGEFSGDCATDIAVFQPGGGIGRDDPMSTQGHWRLCPTASNPLATTCTSPTTVAFGAREDTPLPDLRFATGSARYFTVFRQRTSQFMWRSTTSSTVTTKSFQGTGLIALPGLYDSDSLTDLAVYEPKTATFRLLQSSDGYASTITKTLSSNFVPQISGTPLQRSGAIPLAGMNKKVTTTIPPYGLQLSFPRQTFSLFSPQTLQWTTVWHATNPLVLPTHCTYGSNAASVPIPGIDFNGDMISDLVYFAPSDDGSGTIFAKESGSSFCTGATQTWSVPTSGWKKTKVFAVSDMSGDGKPDILLVNPDTMQVKWLRSNFNYTSNGTVLTLGSPDAVLL